MKTGKAILVESAMVPVIAVKPIGKDGIPKSNSTALRGTPVIVRKGKKDDKRSNECG